MNVETFKAEIAEALRAYEKYIVCLEKTPDQFRATVESLIAQAIRAYETRAPNLRHGIALDRYITVILSQTDGPKPLCGIYFNLHSPYQKQLLSKAAKSEKSGEPRHTHEA
ncbi:MAG: hypothetical protein N2379_10345 [Verrucomicrobiae bacterium]|nr:hypothetical protein [Verrucomicrobiae bacterium]